MKVILHLGGNPDRIYKTIDMAKQYPLAQIIISTESNPEFIIEQLVLAGISPWRCWFDYRPWDTVTHFTSIYDELVRTGVTELYVSTDEHQIFRGAAIGKIILLGSGITLYACTNPVTPATESALRLVKDMCRSLIWKITFRKWLIFDRTIKSARMPDIQHWAAIIERDGRYDVIKS